MQDARTQELIGQLLDHLRGQVTTEIFERLRGPAPATNGQHKEPPKPVKDQAKAEAQPVKRKPRRKIRRYFTPEERDSIRREILLHLPDAGAGFVEIRNAVQALKAMPPARASSFLKAMRYARLVRTEGKTQNTRWFRVEPTPIREHW